MVDDIRGRGVPMYVQHVEPKEPRPMSESDRRALRIALADGKICWIEWSPIDGCSKRDKFKLDLNFNLYILQDNGDWHLTGVGADRWLSWSEAHEPRVWEGEGVTDETHAGSFVFHIEHSGPIPAKVRYRIEEILP